MSLVVILATTTACAGARTASSVSPPLTLRGRLDGGVYTSPDSVLRVRVPPVFADWSEAESRVDWQDLSVFMPVEVDLRVEDGYSEVDGTKIAWVIFGPSASRPDEIYHVVVAEPPPYHRYDDLTHYTREVVDGYLDQYDTQYAGRATEISSRYVSTAGHDAIYAAFRYDFDVGSRRNASRYHFYTTFCLFTTPGHRLVTILTEHRPAATGSGGRNFEEWREQSFKTGGCWNEWIATLQLDDAARPPLTFQ